LFVISKSDADGDSNTDCNRAECYSDGYGHRYRHGHAHSDRYRHLYGHGNTNSYPDGHPHVHT
jgi:hypothetical protein